MKPLRTFPTTLMAAISFVEDRGDVAMENRISQQGIVKRAADSLRMSLEQNAVPTRKAPAYLLIMVVALELMIYDMEVPFFLRFVAWTKLLRIWGSLRSDDLQGLAPHFIRWMPSGITGHLDRSKT
eukprot:2713061-Karenia_brevis.AAC.1